MKGYKYNGKKYRSYRELAEAVGIPPYLLYNRICNSVGKNMTIEEAIQTPIKNASECAAKPITAIILPKRKIHSSMRMLKWIIFRMG